MKKKKENAVDEIAANLVAIMIQSSVDGFKKMPSHTKIFKKLKLYQITT